MYNLLRAEFYKLWRKKSFWGVTGFSIILGTILMLDRKGLNSAEDLFYASLYCTPVLYLVIIIFCALHVGEEFENRSIQAYLCAGHNRDCVLIAKAVSYLTACMIILTSPLLTALLTGVLLFGWNRTVLPEQLLSQAVLILIGICAMGGLPFMLAFVFRDMGKTLAVPMTLFFLMIVALNGNRAIWDFLPMGQLRLLSMERTAASMGGWFLVDGIWLVGCFWAAWLVFSHSELK